mgnify:FL=1
MNPVLLGLTVFLTAAGALIVEIVAARLMAPVVGMSVYTWTAIIAVVLSGLTAGHWVAGRLVAGTADPVRGSRVVAGALLLAAAATMIALALRPLAEPMIAALGGVNLATIVVLTLVMFFAPSFFAGIVSPIATNMALVDTGDRQGQVLGRMFALGAAGSILGTLLAGFVMISWLGSFRSMITVAAVYAGLGSVFWLWSSRSRIMPMIAILILGGLGWGSADLARAHDPCLKESRYYCLSLLDASEAAGFPSRGLKIDGWLHSVEARDGSDRLYIEAHHFVDEYARARFSEVGGPASAFILGGGGLTVPERWRVDFPKSRLVVAEIDPEVTGFALEHFAVTIKPPLTVLHEDGRTALARQPVNVGYDIVHNDAYQGLTMPSHLVTREFNRLVKERLSAGGAYVVNLIDSSAAPAFLLSMTRTLALDFPSVEVWRLEREPNRRGRRMHYGIVAGAQPSRFDRLIAARGIQRSWLRLDTELMETLATGMTVPILTDDYAPVERLLANYCSLRFLATIGINIGRPEACGERRS